MDKEISMSQAIEKVYGSLEAIPFEDDMYVIRDDGNTYAFVSFDDQEGIALTGFGAYTEEMSLERCIENLQELGLRVNDFEKRGYTVFEDEIIHAPDGKRYELIIPIVDQPKLDKLVEDLNSVSIYYSNALVMS
jgi:hypothetical protein